MRPYLRPYLPRHCGVELQPLVELVEANLRAVQDGPDGWPEGLPMPVIAATVSS